MKTTIEQIKNSYRYKRLMNSKGWNFQQKQTKMILEVLLDSFWNDVPLTRIIIIDWRVIAQYNTRIHELRQMWFVIENTLCSVYDEKYDCLVKHSLFKLVWLK